MAAAMNGMALHGGIVPYGGTFLVFSDYCRPAIRLSALMRQRVIYVMTHDFDRARRGRPDPPAGRASRGAARHAQSQRLAPGRFGRMRRVLGACAAGQDHAHHSGSDAPGRAAAPHHADEENLSAKGAYVLIEPEGGRDVTLIATGSELALAVEAAKALARGGGPRRGGVDAVLGAVRGAKRRLSQRGPGHGAARRRRGRGPFGWDQWLGPTAPSSACMDSVHRRPPKTYISISASPPRPSRPRRVAS